MEYVTGIKIRDIFLNHGNWWKLFLKHHKLIRRSIILNVLKLLVCRTNFLGYHIFVCPQCNKTIKSPHSCKSRFCSSCGKKATDNWIRTSFYTLPDTTWQHITFTLPEELWDFFWINRYLLNSIPSLAARIIKKLAMKQGFIPGIFLAIHTFGRDLSRNVHLHLATTIGGLSPSSDKWVVQAFFPHSPIKKMWRYAIISLLRKEFRLGRLTLPPHLKHIKSYTAFSSWTYLLYNKTWIVHLNKHSNNKKKNVEYLGKYLKRPPIGETRIKHYDSSYVRFEYLDHYSHTKESTTLPVLEFIKRLICHIPDKNFRNIRYYGFLAHRVRGKLLPLVFSLLNIKHTFKTKVFLSWRNLIQQLFHYDPLRCPFCSTLMNFKNIVLPLSPSLIPFHQEIAHGFFPIL